MEGGTYVYRCRGDERFTLRVQADSASIRRGLFTARLPRQGGLRFSDGETTFQGGAGGEAELVTATERLEDCRGRVAASAWEVSRLLGYELRAIGQEPGWVVEIDPGRRMRVLAEYGRVEFFTGAPVVAASGDGTQTFRASATGLEVVVTVREQPCQDAMSGESFPLSVTLRLDGREYEGCGRRAPQPSARNPPRSLSSGPG